MTEVPEKEEKEIEGVFELPEEEVGFFTWATIISTIGCFALEYYRNLYGQTYTDTLVLIGVWSLVIATAVAKGFLMGFILMVIHRLVKLMKTPEKMLKKE